VEIVGCKQIVVTPATTRSITHPFLLRFCIFEHQSFRSRRTFIIPWMPLLSLNSIIDNSSSLYRPSKTILLSNVNLFDLIHYNADHSLEVSPLRTGRYFPLLPILIPQMRRLYPLPEQDSLI